MMKLIFDVSNIIKNVEGLLTLAITLGFLPMISVEEDGSLSAAGMFRIYELIRVGLRFELPLQAV